VQMKGSARGEQVRPCRFHECTGYCRHGTECRNRHTLFTGGRMLMLRNIIPRIQYTDRAELYKFYDHCFEDIFLRLVQLGPLQDFLVAENTNHLAGTVYAQYASQVAAQDAASKLSDTYYAGFPVKAEVIGVENVHKMLCRDEYASGKPGSKCAHGLSCSFVHKFLPQQSMWEGMKPLLSPNQRQASYKHAIKK
ncbi:Hypothetical protein GSB_16554, partial [Giardia duodenalis]